MKIDDLEDEGCLDSSVSTVDVCPAPSSLMTTLGFPWRQQNPRLTFCVCFPIWGDLCVVPYEPSSDQRGSHQENIGLSYLLSSIEHGYDTEHLDSLPVTMRQPSIEKGWV